MRNRKLNNIIKVSALAGIGVVMFTACDNIPEADRFIKVERPVIERNVLLFDFTGIRCVNCPDAAEAIHELQQSYPQVIAVGLHPEGHPFTEPLRGLDLRCHEATVIYNNFINDTSLPQAVIDGGAPNNMYTTWSTEAITALKKPAPATIALDIDYDAAKREVVVNYDVKFNQGYTGNCSVMVWVMENGIVGPQQLSSGVKRDYTHNHVLRASLNGDWGQPLDGTSFMPDQIVEGAAAMVLDESWVPENCQIVAFMFQTGSKVVEQAEIADLISTETPTE